MKADWMLPEHKKLEVTLKILQDDTYQGVRIDYDIYASMYGI